MVGCYQFSHLADSSSSLSAGITNIFGRYCCASPSSFNGYSLAWLSACSCGYFLKVLNPVIDLRSV